MQDKYTALISRAPADLAAAPDRTFALTFNTQTNRVQEFNPGRALPAASAGMAVYTIPDSPVETMFAVHSAIRCTRPDGREFSPGFCLGMTLTYVSSSGMQRLLLASRQRNSGRLPDCITLEDLYALLAGDIRTICATAAETFSQKQTLSYTHWWQDLMNGTTFRDLIHTQLMQLFNTYGFRLDRNSFTIAGLAPVPVE